MKMRVCFMIPDLHDGGAQVQCLRLLEALQDRADIEPMLIYLHEGVHSHRLSNARYRVERIAVRSNYDPRNIARIHAALRDFRPDLLVTWLHACDVYGFFLSKLRPSVPWLMTERGSAYPPGLRFQLRDKLGRHAHAIISNSAAGRRYWEAMKPKGKLYVVPNIVAPPPPRPSLTFGAPRVAMVGRLEDQKNPLVTVAAFCELAKQRPDLEFIIVGEGSLRPQIEAMIAAAGLDGRIALLGFRDDAPVLIASARLLVALSHNEGTPNVLLEAITAGTPAVLSDIPEHREVVGDDYPLLVADRHDAGACVRQMLAALTPGDWPDYYGHARERTARMSPQGVAERYVEIFEAFLGPAARSRSAQSAEGGSSRTPASEGSG